MGGTMGVESIVGQGSTFWMQFAVVEGPLQQAQRQKEDLPQPVELGVSQKARIILYVEDNLSNLKLIQRLLAHRPDVRLIPAMQGRLGLDLAREHRPDLILLDLHLPDLPGEVILRRLQEVPETSDIPVIVISADATPGQIKRLSNAGAHNYLTKPIDVKKFLDLLSEILRESASSDA
jgi:CheY-like chemotaxis protein